MILESFWSLLQILAGFGVSVALGFGASFALLPAVHRRYALVVAPCVGAPLFCLLAISTSASLRLPVNQSLWAALAVLAASSVAAAAIAARRHEWRRLWEVAKTPAWSLAAMAIVAFWPALYQGTDLYLGTANPDFYQSLAYQEALARFNLGALAPRPAIDYSLDPFLSVFPDQLPARFGAVMFSMLLQKVLVISPRAALMACLVVLLLALPLATYLFTKIVMEASDRVAGLAAVLMAISAPVTMSFMHVLVGQNTSLALLPLGITLCFAAISLRDWRGVLLALLVLDATFWMYVMLLPYIGAPVGTYALYDAVRNRRGAARWIITALGIVFVVIFLLQWRMGPESRQLITDITGLLGRANRSVYIDFLTEMSIPYSVGIISYPLTSSFLVSLSHSPNYVAWAVGMVAFSFAVVAFYFRAIATWARQASMPNRVFVLTTLAIYATVWLYFTFVSLYGYAVFKMASWLQFFFVPFIAYGLWEFVLRREESAARRVGIGAVVASLIGAGFVAGNALAALDFGMKSLGHDTRKGAIVNAYGIGGNRDYLDLEAALRRIAKPGEVVAIAMPDFISNLWTAYYVTKAGMRASFISHDDFPDEDVLLPDVATGIVRDTAGRVAVYQPRYVSARPPDYYLLEGPGNLNKEIARPASRLEPVWSDGTFILVEGSKARDLLVTARGFYRLEYFDAERLSWWWPERMRWTPEGGEFLLLNASRPDLPHRLSFVAVAGKDREKPRHLELWFNGKLFDEVVVHGAARVVSKPFHPTGGRDKIVVKVREQVTISSRNFGLWNRQIATDPRFLNLVVAQAKVVAGPEATASAADGKLSPKELIDKSIHFDGISLDGWASPTAQVELPIPDGERKATLRISIPGWAGLHFPFGVSFEVNGRHVERQFANPGPQVVEFMGLDGGLLSLHMRSEQSLVLPGVGVGSFTIQSLEVR